MGVWNLDEHVESGSEQETFSQENPKDETPVTKRILENLLELGKSRPKSTYNISETVEETLLETCSEALLSWPKRNLWVSKSDVTWMDWCETGYKASKEAGYSGVSIASIVGDIAHQCFQMAYMNAGETTRRYVEESVQYLNETSVEFKEFWDSASMAVQTDIKIKAGSRVTSYIETWPQIDEKWTPRFEEPLQVKIKNLTLAGKPDLTLGRPKPSGMQSMLLVDFKTGNLKEEHMAEAKFYALCSTLKHEVMPFKSCVYSLAENKWVEYKPTEETMLETAKETGEKIVSVIEVLTSKRQSTLNPGGWCSWCVLKDTCSKEKS